MGVIAVYSIFGFQYLTMMPVVARDVLHTGASGYGLLLTFVGIGALTGALLLASVGARIRRGRLFNATAYAFAGLVIVFSLARVHVAAFVLLSLDSRSDQRALANGSCSRSCPTSCADA